MTFHRHGALVVLLVLLAPASLGQTPAPPPAPAKKDKKVLTNEDLDRLNGGVNVVGETGSWKDNADTPATKADSGAAKPPNQEQARDENCNTQGLAMAIGVALRAEGVAMGRDELMGRLYGADICSPNMGNVPSLVQRMEGDYTLGNGRKIHLAAAYRDGPPGSVNLIEANDKGRHFVIVWKGVAYVHTGVEYIEQTIVDSNGGWGKNFVTTSITLFDPYRNRTVIFRNPPSEIESSVLFTVSARQ